MKESSTRTSPLHIARPLALCLTLTTACLAFAQSNPSQQTQVHRVCSNRTIAGSYGMQIEGTILGPDLPLRTIVMETFDGAGSFSSVDHVVVGGQPPAPSEEWRPGAGTYSVNPDCTGVASVDVGPGNPPLTYHFVIVDKGRQILLVVDGGAIRGVAYRME